MGKSHTGSCLCGKVSAEFTPDKEEFGACHCGMCQKWTGGPSLAIDGGTAVSFIGESKNNLSVYSSSDWAERGFCSHCGSCIFYRLKGKEHYFFNLGFLNNSSDFKFDHQIFIDDKPAHYEFSNPTKKLTGAEVFAAYQSE